VRYTPRHDRLGSDTSCAAVIKTAAHRLPGHDFRGSSLTAQRAFQPTRLRKFLVADSIVVRQLTQVLLRLGTVETSAIAAHD
jgi:hypothetical protein